MQVETGGSQLRAYVRESDAETNRQVEQTLKASSDGDGQSPTASVEEPQQETSEVNYEKSDTAALTGNNLDISV